QLNKVSDTSGAGDWCTAGLIYALLTNRALKPISIGESDIAKALIFGQALASLNCMTVGARGLLRVMQPQAVIAIATELCELQLNQTPPTNDAPTSPPAATRTEALLKQASDSSRRLDRTFRG